MKRKTGILLMVLLMGWGLCQAQEPETIKLPEAQKSGGMPLMEAFQNRQSQRSFSDRELSMQEMSGLLWAAYGYNRPDGRTVPSARAFNEFDIYVVTQKGWYVYDAREHALQTMGHEDLREFTGLQDFVKTAPVNLVYVADFERMTGADAEAQVFYSACDVGFIAQNVYLFCASQGLATVVRGMIDKEKAKEMFNLRSTQHVILSQTVGYPANQ